MYMHERHVVSCRGINIAVLSESDPQITNLIDRSYLLLFFFISGDLSSIFNTTARSRRSERKEIRYKRKVSRKLSHQLSIDNDILVSTVNLATPYRNF